LRLPEICMDDLAEEEAEGVDDEGMMMKNQACARECFQVRAQDPVLGVESPDPTSAITCG
jgi:hypothetical protein